MKLLVWVSCLPLVAGHGALFHPPSWFMADGKPGLCPMTTTRWDLGQMWYKNYTYIPGEKTIADDSPLRTFTNLTDPYGWAPPADKHPWRAPGSAPIDSPCGAYGGNAKGCFHHDGTHSPCDVGGIANGPDARDYYNQGKFKNVFTTEWQVGSVVEAGWIMWSNHAGGYSYRLCPRTSSLTEECFQSNHLDFVGNKHIIQWGANKSTRVEIPAMYTREGTHPAGSHWARIPIPACSGSSAGWYYNTTKATVMGDGSSCYCEQYPWKPENPTWTGTQFEPPLPGLYGWGTNYGNDRVSHNHLPFFIMDRLQVPPNLATGDYVLSFRWDVEQGAQVWNTCADIKLVSNEVPEVEPDCNAPTMVV